MVGDAFEVNILFIISLSIFPCLCDRIDMLASHPFESGFVITIVVRFIYKIITSRCVHK